MTVHNLIKWFETVNCIQIARDVEACRMLFPNEGFEVKTVGGGIAAITAERFGPKLNNVVGLGIHRGLRDGEMEQIESWFFDKGVGIFVFLCPGSAVEMSHLTARGYKVAMHLQALVTPLHDIPIHDTIGSNDIVARLNLQIIMSPAAPSDAELFVQASAQGFQNAVGLQTDADEAFARMAAQRSDTILYIGRVDGEVAATAATAIIETEYGKAAWLYLASTVPRYRRYGMQRAVGRARLLDARDRGCDMAFVITVDGSAGGKGTVDLGLYEAYKKAVLYKSPPPNHTMPRESLL